MPVQLVGLCCVAAIVIFGLLRAAGGNLCADGNKACKSCQTFQNLYSRFSNNTDTADTCDSNFYIQQEAPQ